MALEDLTAKFLAFTNPEPDATPDIDEVMAGVTEVYNADIDIRDSAVRAREEKIEALNKENALLKQKNYDLLVKTPASNVADTNDNKNSEPDENERAATININDLFEGR